MHGLKFCSIGMGDMYHLATEPKLKSTSTGTLYVSQPMYRWYLVIKINIGGLASDIHYKNTTVIPYKRFIITTVWIQMPDVMLDEQKKINK